MKKRGSVTRAERFRLTFVLWVGVLGGAETLACRLATQMRRRGVDARMLFVCGVGQMEALLEEAAVPFTALNMGRGRTVLRRCRDFSKAVGADSHSGAVLCAQGYLALALRMGGFSGTVAAVEHGSLLQEPSLPLMRRLLRKVDRLCGVSQVDVLVTVSDYMHEAALQRAHPRRVVTIRNSVDLELFSPRRCPRESTAAVVIGAAGRLVPGKGFEDLIEALAKMRNERCVLRIAGDGPMMTDLAGLASRLAVADRVELVGPVVDMPDFWRSLDIAVVPSSTLVESFSMTAAEAMACGLPVVATNSGAIPELIEHGVTGVICAPGPEGLAAALGQYVADSGLRNEHGSRARAFAEENLSIDAAVEAYLGLFDCDV